MNDLAETITEQICQKLDIKCWVQDTENCEKFSEQAQDIFNIIIDSNLINADKLK